MGGGCVHRGRGAVTLDRLAYTHRMNTTPTPAVDSPSLDEPWLLLKLLIDDGDPEPITTFLDNLPPWEQARAVSRLSEAGKTRLLEMLPPDRAADLMEIVTITQAVDLIEQLEPAAAATIIGQLRSDRQADLLAEMPEGQSEAILGQLDPRQAAAARRLAEYDPQTAGGLMVTEFLAYYHHLTIGDVIDDLRARADEYADYAVQYAYVVNARGLLLGVLPLRDLLFAPRQRQLEEVMIRQPVSVSDDMSLEALEQFFDSRSFVGVPVVDAEGGLLGVVQRSDVDQAAENRAQSMFMKFSGIVGGEEFRTMPTWLRSSRRLAWLTPNIGLNILAATVIAFYQDTLQAVIALAVFLPMISDMSGCSGNQAVAISMRELTLGLIRPRELARVLWKEASVGLINGLFLGLLLGLIAWLWMGDPWLGVVVGAALGVNTIVAVSLGGVLPLLLKRLKLDPAMVSSPILTTVTDMCGFFLALSFTAAMMAKLAPAAT